MGDQQIFNVNAKGRCIDGVEGMLRIHKSGHTTSLLHLGNGMQREGGLTGTLRPIDLHYSALGIAPTQGQIQGEGAGADGFHPHAGRIPQAHDRTLAEIALDLIQDKPQGLVALGRCPTIGSGTIS